MQAYSTLNCARQKNKPKGERWEKLEWQLEESQLGFIPAEIKTKSEFTTQHEYILNKTEKELIMLSVLNML